MAGLGVGAERECAALDCQTKFFFFTLRPKFFPLVHFHKLRVMYMNGEIMSLLSLISNYNMSISLIYKYGQQFF